MKYYDIQNRGEITFGEFAKAMDKVGLQVFSRDVREIFNNTYRNFKTYLMHMIRMVMGC